MIRNYIKVAWRSLQKNKLQTSINVLGLTVGTVSCLCILVYVNTLLNYDTQYKDSDSLYRIGSVIKQNTENGLNATTATTSPPIAFALKSDFPEVQEACRVVYFGSGNEALLRVSGQKEGYYEPKGYIVDPTFFSLFNFPFIEGNRSEKVLEDPNAIVLSSKLSQKLFGSESALNKTLVLGSGENAQTLNVTGVFDDEFGKTHLKPNYLLSMNAPGTAEFVRNVENFATQNFAYSYIKLVPGANVHTLESKFAGFIESHGAKDLEAAGFKKKLFLQPIKDINLYSKGIEIQLDEVSSIQFIYVLLLLALFIQLVACINFINLSTARANKRAKEIGIRKVVGADKGSLIGQFMGESLLLSLFAAIISIPITLALIPFLNELTRGSVRIIDVLNIKILGILIIVSLLTGLLAGIYPALLLSSIKPIKVLKGITSLNSGSVNFRKALVVFQFVISIFLISSVLIITQQLKYAQSKDLGFNKENLLAIQLGNNSSASSFKSLKTQMLTVAGISEVSGSDFYPSQNVLSDFGMHLPGKNPKNKTLVKVNAVADNYLSTNGIPLLAGRELQAQDEQQIVVNESALKAFNIPLENAIGQKLLSTYNDTTQEFEIVGVARDYNFASLKEPIAPIMLYYKQAPGWLLVKAKTSSYERLLGDIKIAWKTINPDTPLVYNFVDEHVNSLYAEEKRLAQISIVFTVLAILISCLGLFGLVSYVAEQKKKEIGIRKVLGASINNVVRLLTKDFLKLVVIAFFIAAPLAYFLMEKWLQDFNYRIDISVWVFLISGLTAILITLFTVSFQAIKAALTNPVKSLRTE